MLVLAIRNSDGVVMPLRQDSPNHNPGSVARNAARQFQGLPEDYREWAVPDKEKELYLYAKELRWDERAGRVNAIPFSGEAREERQRCIRKAAVENEMIRTQVELDAAEKLGLDVAGRRAKLSTLKAQHEEIQAKGKVYGSEADI